MRFIFLGALVFISTSSFAGPAVLFEEVEVQTVSSEKSVLSHKSTETKIQPLSQRTSLQDVYSNQEYESAIEVRSKRRVGVGLQSMGSLGLLGLMIELNFQPENSVVTGFGGGPGYNAFSFQWRHLFLGKKISPSMGLGYARWYNASTSTNLDQTIPSVLGSRFLTAEEKVSGKFGVDLLTPNIGLQYNVLTGPQAGAAYFAEINFLTRITQLTPVATAAFGALYYF